MALPTRRDLRIAANLAAIREARIKAAHKLPGTPLDPPGSPGYAARNSVTVATDSQGFLIETIGAPKGT